MSIGVNVDTTIKRLRKTIVVKIKALIGKYKYMPGMCVIFAVTNKKNCENTSPNCMPKKIDKIPINIFSMKTRRCNCFLDIPKTVKTPNCFFLTFKKCQWNIVKRRKKKIQLLLLKISLILKFQRPCQSFVISDGISKQQMKRKRQSKRTTYKVSKISSRVARDVFKCKLPKCHKLYLRLEDIEVVLLQKCMRVSSHTFCLHMSRSCFGHLLRMF